MILSSADAGGYAGGGRAALAAAAAVASSTLTQRPSRTTTSPATVTGFGADVTVDVSQQDVVEVVTEVTSGEMADVVVDISASDTQPVVDAIHAVRPGGTVVLAGMKNGKPIPNFVSDDLINRQVTVIGVQAVDYPAYAEALEIIASGRYPLDKMRTHEFALEDAEHAISVLARDTKDGSDPVSVALRPIPAQD